MTKFIKYLVYNILHVEVGNNKKYGFVLIEDEGS